MPQLYPCGHLAAFSEYLNSSRRPESQKMPGWNLMGDNFQPGTLILVIDGEPQWVTPIPKLFQKTFLQPA
jgi:hypothetical protein